MSIDPERLGERFHVAYTEGSPLKPGEVPDTMTVEEAYAAQGVFVERRIPEEGEVVGYKVGATSEAVRSDLGLDSPVYGRVLADTVREGHRFPTGELIDPQVEPEFVFQLGEGLGPDATRREVLAATRFVVPAVEVVDCRIRDWTVTAPTAIADNSLARGLVLGERSGPAGSDLAREGVEVLVDGERRASGIGAAVLSHPAEAVAWLAEALADHGEGLEAGDLVTTGSVTEPIPVEAGETVVVRFSSLGTVVAHAA